MSPWGKSWWWSFICTFKKKVSKFCKPREKKHEMWDVRFPAEQCRTSATSMPHVLQVLHNIQLVHPVQLGVRLLAGVTFYTKLIYVIICSVPPAGFSMLWEYLNIRLIKTSSNRFSLGFIKELQAINYNWCAISFCKLLVCNDNMRWWNKVRSRPSSVQKKRKRWAKTEKASAYAGLSRSTERAHKDTSKGDIKSWRTAPQRATLVWNFACFPLQGHLV